MDLYIQYSILQSIVWKEVKADQYVWTKGNIFTPVENRKMCLNQGRSMEQMSYPAEKDREGIGNNYDSNSKINVFLPKSKQAFPFHYFVASISFNWSNRQNAQSTSTQNSPYTFSTAFCSIPFPSVTPKTHSHSLYVRPHRPSLDGSQSMRAEKKTHRRPRNPSRRDALRR